jgi:hypothetical protein
MLNSLNRVCNCVQLKRGREIGAFARDEQNNGSGGRLSHPGGPSVDAFINQADDHFSACRRGRLPRGLEIPFREARKTARGR